MRISVFLELGFLLILLSVVSSSVLVMPFFLAFGVYIALRKNDDVVFLTLFLICFQNLTLSFFYQYFDVSAYLSLARGSNYFFIAGLFLGTLISVLSTKTSIKIQYVNIIVALLVLILVYYSAFGYLDSDFFSAASYFRLFTTFLFLLFVSVNAKSSFLDTVRSSSIVFSTYLFFVLLEVVFKAGFYDFFKIHGYLDGLYGWDLNSGLDVKESIRRRFLNLSISGDNLNSYRYLGPTLHAISNAYVLSIGALVFLWNKSWFRFLSSIFLVFLVGAKGPIAVVLLALLYMFCKIFLLKKTPLLIVNTNLLVYGFVFIMLVFLYGSVEVNYHLIGLKGALVGFIENPFGFGIGVGGNLSTLNDASRDFKSWVTIGYSPYALETALGVLLYQVGLFSFVYIFFILWVVIMVNRSRNLIESSTLFGSALFFILVNSIFQEEAFSPTALGIISIICGTILRYKLAQSKNNLVGEV